MPVLIYPRVSWEWWSQDPVLQAGQDPGALRPVRTYTWIRA